MPSIDLVVRRKFNEIRRGIVEGLVAKNARLLAKSLLSAALATPERLDYHCKGKKTMIAKILEHLAR